MIGGKVAALALTACLMGALAAAQPTAAASGAASGQTLTIAFSQTLTTLDPAVTDQTAVQEVDVNIFDTLVWATAPGVFTPDLATSWKISDGGKVYTFQLRKGVTFTDGTPFNAAAAAFNFERILNPATKAVGGLASVGPLTSAKATGPYTLVLTFSEPFPAFLTYLAGPNLDMQSPTAIKKEGSTYGNDPVGTGPFMIKSYTPNSELVLVRNPHYDWAPPALHTNGPAKLAGIVYELEVDGGTRVDSFLAGEAQELDATPPLYYEKLGAEPQYTKFPVPIAGAGEYAAINNAKWPTNQLAVRQAIEYFVNRPGLVELADQGQYPVSWGPIQAGTPGYDPAFNGMYAYNVAKGDAVLEKAGWKKVDGVWTKGGRKLSLLITTIADYQDLPDFATGIAGYLEKAGMVVKIEQLGASVWTADCLKGTENLTPLWLTNTDPELLQLLYSPGQFFNFSKYDNPTVTKLLDEAEVDTNPTGRLNLYDQVQTILMDQAVMLPERLNEDLILLSKSVKGVIDYFGGNPYYYKTTISG
jgi:peptide/nickel transport system substrate-binding protein